MNVNSYYRFLEDEFKRIVEIVIVNVTFEPLTKEHVFHIYKNMRAYDKMELSNLGCHTAQEAYDRIFTYCSIKGCSLANGEPISMYGFAPSDDCVYGFFVGTPQLKQIPITLHREVKRGLKVARATYPGMPIRAIVLDTYKTSANWLKRLGFKETVNTIAPGNIIMELT